MKRPALYNMVLTAMFIAMGVLLPFVTGQIPDYGKVLCPMHITVMLCGAVCGWQWGMAAGIITPLLRSLLFTVPVIYPTAVAMSVELAVYGVTVGIMLALFGGKMDRLASVYASLLVAMVLGRAALLVANFAMMGMFGTPYSWEIFKADAIISAIPALILQFAVLPPLIYTFRKSSRRRR